VELPVMAQEVKNDAQVSVTLSKDKKVFVNSQEVTQADLVKVLREKLDDPKLQNKHVIFCGDRGLLMKEVVTVMMMCNEAGSDQVSIKTSVKKEKE